MIAPSRLPLEAGKCNNRAILFAVVLPSSCGCPGLVYKQFVTSDISGQMILLGTGTSIGVPVIGCGCDVCRNGDPRNKRTRCSAILGLPEGNLLVDTAPDLRAQLLREDIGIAHAVLYTHDHADHVFGLDDLRLFQYYLQGPVPLYCEETVQRRIERSFDYAFIPPEKLPPSSVPKIAFHRIGLDSFLLLGTQIIPMRLKHGPICQVLGFRFGNVAYCTDTNDIPPESLALLQGLDVLILDALREKPHPTHFAIEEAVEIAKQLQPRQTYFTHMGHDLEYTATNAWLPKKMQLAYDGLRIPLT